MASVSVATRHKVVTLLEHPSVSKVSHWQKGVSRCALQALLKMHEETDKVVDIKLHQADIPSQSEDVQQHHQLRTCRNQWDPGTSIHSQEKCCPHARFAAINPFLWCLSKAKLLTYARKHKNWGAEKLVAGVLDHWAKMWNIVLKQKAVKLQGWVFAGNSEVWWRFLSGLELHFCKESWRFCQN